MPTSTTVTSTSKIHQSMCSSPFRLSVVRRTNGGERRESSGGAERNAGAEPPAPAVLGDAALHPGEEVGRGLDVVGARVERVAQAVFEPASSVALQSLFEGGEAPLEMGLHRVR